MQLALSSIVKTKSTVKIARQGLVVFEINLKQNVFILSYFLS